MVCWLIVQTCIFIALGALPASFIGKRVFFVGFLRDLHAHILADYFEKGLLIFIHSSVLQRFGILQDRFVIVQVTKRFVCAARNQRILHGLILGV